MSNSTISEIRKIIRDVANDFALRIENKPFLETITKQLKFEKDEDWATLCSLLDVIGDTELAKKNFRLFGLSGPTKIFDLGEQYIRLYGILNAIYLQTNSIINFVELAKLKDKKKIETKFNGLKLLQVRHIAGAHTIDFLENEKKIPHQIHRNKLEGDIVKTTDSKNNLKEFDLINLLDEYDKLAENTLMEACEKFMNTVFKNMAIRKEKFEKELSFVKLKKDGHYIIRSEDQSKEPFIIKTSK